MPGVYHAAEACEKQISCLLTGDAANYVNSLDADVDADTASRRYVETTPFEHVFDRKLYRCESLAWLQIY